MNHHPQGYPIVLEPSIYEELHWDMDLIVKCLYVLQRKLHLQFELPSTITAELFVVKNFLNQEYPAIGLRSTSDRQIDPSVFQSMDLNEALDKIFNSMGPEGTVEEAQKVDIVSWNRLREVGSYTIV